MFKNIRRPTWLHHTSGEVFFFPPPTRPSVLLKKRRKKEERIENVKKSSVLGWHKRRPTLSPAVSGSPTPPIRGRLNRPPGANNPLFYLYTSFFFFT